MNPEPVTLDEATATKLAGANGAAIPLCDPAGGVVAYGVSPERLEKLEEAYRMIVADLDRIWPPEKIREITERLKDKSRRKYSTEDVLRLVEGE